MGLRILLALGTEACLHFAVLIEMELSPTDINDGLHQKKYFRHRLPGQRNQYRQNDKVTDDNRPSSSTNPRTSPGTPRTLMLSPVSRRYLPSGGRSGTGPSPPYRARFYRGTVRYGTKPTIPRMFLSGDGPVRDQAHHTAHVFIGGRSGTGPSPPYRACFYQRSAFSLQQLSFRPSSLSRTIPRMFLSTISLSFAATFIQTIGSVSNHAAHVFINARPFVCSNFHSDHRVCPEPDGACFY
jgi:hypothetical protein